MTRDEESYFAMALKTKNFYARNTAAMASIPALAGLYTQLSTLVTTLISADTGSRADLTGFTLDKATKRKTVETLALKISNAVASLAAINSDLILKKRADFPSSSWYIISEEELVTQATIIRDLGQANATAMAPYGAAAADITALSAALTTFIDVITNPTLALDQRKNDNRRIPEIIDQIRTLFEEKLDVVMRSYELSNPSLYNLYNSARAIDINGSKSSPTVIKDILPGTLVAIYQSPAYDANTFYTIQNMGDQAVSFSLSTTETLEGPEPVLLSGGDTKSRLAETLAPQGIYFIVKNSGTLAVTVRLWVE